MNTDWDVIPVHPGDEATLIDETDGERCYLCKCQRFNADKELPYRILVVRESDLMPVYSMGRLCPTCGATLYIKSNNV
jgi:hypothetical protein